MDGNAEEKIEVAKNRHANSERAGMKKAEPLVGELYVTIFYTHIYECGSRIWKSKGDAQEAAKKEFIDCLKLLEGELEDKPFYGGKSLRCVDVVLIPFACWFYTYETDSNFSIENECPKLIALVKRCMEKESVSKVLSDPHKVYDFVGDLKKKYGVEFW
ncbi:putative glutathione S-transferase parA [Cinnamomum micranthum f. kanehirae]|uniref:Putative glutathione S-transferase parA n=1 Tax=Cinnamomum micranthum f. kanehirae TaxID=337451 RepID=A0A3S3MN11_9MAGN|nr:putative glutathione S-transferase parA [Cinnamomum micranthum f. kanehirae]